ncbi:PDZ domain-containing protein [Pseudomonas aeruginosa]|nr:PDZ domain-containing protein [Pseudomonas aeruginosa]
MLRESDNDYVKVVRLVPAGPAAKSKQIATSDKIIGVAQGKGEMVDVVGWRLDEVVKLIRGPRGSRYAWKRIPRATRRTTRPARSSPSPARR